MPGVPRGLAGHVGHDPPQSVPVAIDRDGETRFRSPAARIMRSLSAIAARYPASTSATARAGEDGHALFVAGVPGGPGEMVAEPVPLRLGRCWTRPRTEVPLSTRTRRSCSSDRPLAFFSTQCRANDKNASAVSSSPNRHVARAPAGSPPSRHSSPATRSNRRTASSRTRRLPDFCLTGSMTWPTPRLSRLRPPSRPALTPSEAAAWRGPGPNARWRSPRSRSWRGSAAAPPPRAARSRRRLPAPAEGARGVPAPAAVADPDHSASNTVLRRP